MAKKIFVSLAIVILCLCCSVCYAADNNSNVNLGEEITDSLDKTGDSVRNVADDVMNGVDDMTRSNREDNSTNNNQTRNTNNNYNNYSNNNGNNGNNYADNNVFSEGYNAVRTTTEDIATGTMSTTTWIWIILAVAAITIIAMVWYYATQTNNRD